MESKRGREAKLRTTVYKNMCALLIFDTIKYQIQYGLKRTEPLIVLPNIK